ncbi:MAG: hypothetical protein M1818_004312 [Claussenomyces sp. TS43310]|nr:MAG: hypothetical protein M1818_004312 [Claussenomyces sp. TS43310]
MSTHLRHSSLKRSRELEDPAIPARKLPRTSLVDVAGDDRSCQKATTSVDDTQIDPIEFWRNEGRWPKEFFEPDIMSHLLARQKSSSTLSRKRSETGSATPSLATPSDQKPREEKAASYQDPCYAVLLEK